MSAEPKFIHLRVHSAYSLLEGAIIAKKLPDMCRDAAMPAVALTDTNSMFGALEFSEFASKAGIQPIIACQFSLAYEAASQPGEKAPAPRPIALLAQNEAGWKNLLKLNTALYLECGNAAPHITLAHLKAHSDGLICLTGGSLGPIGQLLQDNHPDKARLLTEHFKTLFPNRL